MTAIAFQGALGAFGEEAASLLWPAGSPLPRRTFSEVIEAVESGEAEGGVLPIQNRIAGPVAESLTALSGRAVQIVDRVDVPVRLHLLGMPGSALDGVRRAASHPVALAQCRRFFAERPTLTAVSWYDTAGAAHDVRSAGDPSFAAIAGHAAQARYGLIVLAADVHDRRDNATTFVAIRRQR